MNNRQESIVLGSRTLVLLGLKVKPYSKEFQDMLSILLRNMQEMNSDEFLKSWAEEFKKRRDPVKRK